ncbi:fimbria/pilus outer membrane usher protein [Tatumella sp. UBA2305]|uniref:fimbria/pilus outer membrane usher protein n=1 Tax=Tatumella sp. UBA2305 TaxID=1947647 RepID=UPI0025F1F10A|nr:fimbria/pilus outer membrane usher protein [Tatumella sp. UBA2305]
MTVTVNGTPISGLFQIRKKDQHFFISANDAKKLNINTQRLSSAGNNIDFSSHPGLLIKYDALQQVLNIQADKQWLGGNQQLNSMRHAGLISNGQLSTPVKGIALNYDLYSSQDVSGQTLTAYTQLRSFGIGPGNFSSSFNSRFEHLKGESDNGTQRLMTSWSYDNPDKLLSLTLGDSYTGSQSWTNSVRFAGISLSHDYTLQPNFNTSSQDVLSDTTALPSTVDLYVQGIKQSSQRVNPGQFTLNTTPFFTGSSTAQVVITDINGQQRVVNLNLYGSNLLLTRGLNTWSVNAGWIRENYTYRSFSYDPDLMLAGNWRYGLTDDLTLEGHTEQGQPLQNGGLGFNYLLSPSLGIVHSDFSVSRHDVNTGKQWGIGWQWSNQRFSASATETRRDSQFRDMSVFTEGTLSTRSDNAFVSWSFDHIGTLGMSWINRQYPKLHQQYAGLSWFKTFGHRINIATSMTQSLENTRDKTLYINVTLPLSESGYMSVQRSQENESTNNQLTLSRVLDSNKPGWGGDLSVQNGDSSDIHADYRQRTRWSDWELGYNRYNHQDNYYTSLSGAVGIFMGHAYATRELGDSFAIVDTAGVPDIPVYLQHRLAGKTDKNGTMFLNDLDPYFKNDITIGVLNLPEDFRALYTEQEVIPKSGGGAVAAFSIYRTHALLITGKQQDGAALPFAAEVGVSDKQGHLPATGTTHTIVGYEGNIYLEDPPASGEVIVHRTDGDCRIKLPAHLPAAKSVVQMEAICQ